MAKNEGISIDEAFELAQVATAGLPVTTRDVSREATKLRRMSRENPERFAREVAPIAELRLG